MAIQLFSGFSHLRPGVIHISLKTHKTHNRESGRKEEQAITNLAYLQVQEGRGLWHFPSILCFCELSRACIWDKFPQSHQERWLILSRWPTRPLVNRPCLMLSSLDSPLRFYSPVLSTALFCRLVSSAHSGTFLPSSSSSLVGNLARTREICLAFASKQTKGSSDWHPHHNHRNECHPSCHSAFWSSRVQSE